MAAASSRFCSRPPLRGRLAQLLPHLCVDALGEPALVLRRRVLTDQLGPLRGSTGADHEVLQLGAQAAYDLRKLRGKDLVDKPGRTRHYLVPPAATHIIAAPTTLRDKVIRDFASA